MFLDSVDVHMTVAHACFVDFFFFLLQRAESHRNNGVYFDGPVGFHGPRSEGLNFYIS